MQRALAVCRLEASCDREPEPGREHDVQLSLRDRPPLAQALGSRAEQDVDGEADAFEDTPDFREVAAPERVLVGQERPDVYEALLGLGSGAGELCDILVEDGATTVS